MCSLLRYSNPDRIKMLSEPLGNWKWDSDWTFRHCLIIIIRPTVQQSLLSDFCAPQMTYPKDGNLIFI